MASTSFLALLLGRDLTTRIGPGQNACKQLPCGQLVSTLRPKGLAFSTPPFRALPQAAYQLGGALRRSAAQGGASAGKPSRRARAGLSWAVEG